MEFRRPYVSSRPAVVLGYVMLLSGFVQCQPLSAHYTPEEDDQAMAQIELLRESDDPGGYVLALEEDQEVSDTVPEETCSVAHVVKGGGRGTDHGVSQDMGCASYCESCPYATVAFVRGELRGDALEAPLEVSGTVYLQTMLKRSPYKFPYWVALSCEGDAVVCSIEGSLREDGTLEASVYIHPQDGEDIAFSTELLPASS